MDEFLEWIRIYIDEQLKQDPSFTKTIPVKLVYKQGNEITINDVPQVQIQIMDNAEVERYSSFDGEHTSSIPLQITAYTGKMQINGVMQEAQPASIKLGRKLKDILNVLRSSVVNKNIIRCRSAAMSPALPLLNGSKVYYTAVRFDFWVANPYVAEV